MEHETPHDRSRGPEPRFTVLGRIGVTADGAAVQLRPQARYVLGLLLQNPGRPVPAGELIRQDGDAGTTESAVAAGRVAASRLRAALAGVGLEAVVATTPGGYALDVDPLDVDHVAFAHAVREAEATEWPDTGIRHLETALALFTGTPFGEWRSEPAFELDAIALEELHRHAVDLWGELAVRTGRHREAIPRLEAAVAAEPLRERRWASLMLAHYRGMNQTEALRAYERARVALAEGVGLEPGPELQRLAEEILQQDPALEWVPQLERARPPDVRGLPGASVVIGRDDEISDVLELLERRRTVNLVGLGGVGKSSVAGEVAMRSSRPTWVVPLAAVRGPGRLARVVAEHVGLSDQVDDDDLVDAIADRLQPGGGLLVLDNCEHLVEAVETFVAQVTRRATDGRILTTSRVGLDIAGAASVVVAPLPVGTRAEPGPAALIAADSAMIPPSRMDEQWPVIEAVCGQADGIPLALELIGAAVANGAPTETVVADVITAAVSTATVALSDEARRAVDILAVLPGAAGIPFLAEVAEVSSVAMARAVGQATRVGLLTRRSLGARGRVALLEPARDVLEPWASSRRPVFDEVRRAVFDLARQVRPSPSSAFDIESSLIVDDEHHIVMWVLEQLPDAEQLELVTLLGGLWAACGRSAEGQRWFVRVEPIAATASPLAAARYWIARSHASPSFATRVPFVDRLRTALDVTLAHGDVREATRAAGELAVGVMWSGQIDEGRALLQRAYELRDVDNRWGELTVVKINAVADVLAGADPAAAVDRLRDTATEFLDVGHMGDVMACLYLAAVGARMAGDPNRMQAVFDAADALEPDRFAGYSHAALSYERANLAVAQRDADAGPRLWEALSRLTTHGEHRTAEVCRRDLGRWRLEHGDEGGAVDLARAARGLLGRDSNAAAVALASLAELAVDGPRSAALTATARAFLDAPGGGPLSADERAFVEGPTAGNDSMAGPLPPAELEALLREIEARVESA